MTEQAREIARQLDRRRARRKLATWAAVVALIALAVTYARCGRGWGLGGSGGGDLGHATGAGAPQAARSARCAVRLDAAGITVDGQRASQAEAITRCTAIGAADVTVTGDAREGDWDQLRAALVLAHVAVYTRTPPPSR